MEFNTAQCVSNPEAENANMPQFAKLIPPGVQIYHLGGCANGYQICINENGNSISSFYVLHKVNLNNGLALVSWRFHDIISSRCTLARPNLSNAVEGWKSITPVLNNAQVFNNGSNRP